MPASTTSIRKVSAAQSHSPTVAPTPLSIGPRGNRSVIPTIKRAPRIAPQNTRDYGKEAAVGFDLPGFRSGQ